MLRYTGTAGKGIAWVAALIALAPGAAVAAPGQVPGAGFLPDGRGWEKVSPADKGGVDVATYFSATRSSTDGDRLVFRSDGASADAESHLLVNDYLAKRGAAGWSTANLMAPVEADIFGAALDARMGYRAYSDDLSRGILVQKDPPLAPGAVPGVNNMYLRDIAAGTYALVSGTPVSALPDPFLDIFSLPVFGGASDDLGHVAFESVQRLTPDAPPSTGALYSGQITNLYEWVDGEGIRLVGILPDGSVPPGAVLGRGLGSTGFGGQPNQNDNHRNEGAVSDDGARIFFTALTGATQAGSTDGATGQVYVRENGASTQHVSASQRTDCAGDPTCGGDDLPDPAPDPAGPLPAKFLGATPDGSVALIRSCEQLTDDSTAFPEAGGGCDRPSGGSAMRADLYAFDVEAGSLARVDLGDLSVRWVVAVSETGDRVYVVADAPDGAAGLYVWDGEGARPVGPPGAVSESVDLDGIAGPWVRGYRSSEASSDGRLFLFESLAPLTGADNLACRDSATGPLRACVEVFLYDAALDELRCLSCRQSGELPSGDASFTPFRAGNKWDRGYVQNALSDDGERAFFDTPSPLVPGDVNGRRDVYQYAVATGQMSLLSNGKLDHDAMFLDSSPSGDDVFFGTTARLVAADRDGLVDVYDARVGGGFPESENAAPPCEGDTCQPLPTAQPRGADPGSERLRGSGDATPTRRAVLSVRSLSNAQRAALTRGRQIALLVRVTRPGTVRATLRARIGGRSRLVGAASKRAREAGTVKLPLRLSKVARRHLGKGRRLSATLVVRSGVAGPRRSVLDLRRPEGAR